MGLFLSRKGPQPDSTPPPETICTKQDQKTWQSTVDRLEKRVSETADARLRENQKACLDWLKKYGYPLPKHEIWAFDGIVRCQKIDEGVKIRAILPGFSDRHQECYAIVSNSFRVDVTLPICLLYLHSRVLLYTWITGSHYRMIRFKRIY